MSPIADYSKFAEREAYERWDMAISIIGSRISLRVAYRHAPNADQEREQLAKERDQLKINDLGKIEEAIKFHSVAYKKERIEFKEKYGS